MRKKNWLFYSGIALIAVGVVALLRIPYFYYHSDSVGHRLLKEANASVGTIGTTKQPTNTAQQTSFSPGALPKGLLGEVYIPALKLKAPLVEGTADKELAVGVGHLKTSVMPGQDGTSIIAAHNATWFRHIDSLKAGDKVEVLTKSGLKTFEVTEHKVVHEGSPVYNSVGPTIVLETCYPTNALYLTPYRLLVYGKWDKGAGQSTPSITDAVNIQYKTNIPQRIVKQGITLTTNSLPMGKLTYQGKPDNKFVQSNAPLLASNAAVNLYLGWLHALEHKDTAALTQLLPSSDTTGAAGMSGPLMGISLQHISYHQNFNVKLDVTGTTLNSITANTEFETGNHLYNITMDCAVKGSAVSISKLTVTKH